MPTKLTTPLVIEQTPELDASIVKDTAKPEVEIALGVYGVPPITAPTGAVEVKLIVCVACSIVRAKVSDAVWAKASVAVTVNVVAASVEVAVPESSPVLVENVRPLGKVAPLRA